MHRVAGMLMIGSAGRGEGKTRFACSLIEKFGAGRDIIGIKVTPVQEADGACPRGGQGCGVCSSLEGHFYITEETDRTADKDTCRMLAAGASKVFWLRVLRRYLEEGADALLDVVGNDTVSVCESNSLRSVVEPDVFVMVEGCGEQGGRVSAKNVVRYADRIVLFDGDEFDIDIGDIGLAGGRWTIKMRATAVIMAGGGSVRMGQDKGMLLIDGKPMIKYIAEQLLPHFSQIIISSNDVSRYSIAGAEAVADEVAGRGPLGGIASSLKASANELNFVIACDIPQVDIDLMKMLVREGREFDAVVPRTGQSKYEPLFAVYKKSALKAIEGALLSGNNRIIDALSSSKVRYVDLNNNQRLKNVNIMDDYREFVGSKDDAGI